ncbi:protein sarah [Schistocerca nitens]|uniref:protein sarah n=1 Tax=Schistocerca nitens TaxID=7011 RepID=UPI0021183073|nr:protein sarah [Schistocerca nitens]
MEEQEGRMAVDSDEPMTNDENNIIINEVDGLPNVHPNYTELELNCDMRHQNPDGERSLEDLIHDEDLPTSLIVTNLESSLFKNDERKKELENLFRQFGEPISFQYFRSFRRLRVNYNCPAAAAKARIQLHQTQFGETVINCYFAQPVSPIGFEDQHLQPPAPVKQFLISPPASPPVGWVPRDEGEPLVNYDLLAAIANLTPGETHELHPPSGDQPGIVVHICEESDSGTQHPKGRIVQTRCPEHK